MKTHIINTAGAVGASVLTLLVGWYDGVDFLMRGKDQVFWTSEALLAAIAVFLFLRSKASHVLPALGPRWARCACTAAAFAVVFGEAWYGGANPFERGHGQGAIFYLAAIAAFVCWTCPLWTPVRIASSKRGA